MNYSSLVADSKLENMYIFSNNITSDVVYNLEEGLENYYSIDYIKKDLDSEFKKYFKKKFLFIDGVYLPEDNFLCLITEVLPMKYFFYSEFIHNIKLYKIITKIKKANSKIIQYVQENRSVK